MDQSDQREYQGSPEDIGCSIFIDCVMPIIKQVSEQPTATARAMAQFYAGMVAAMAGSIAADFGKEGALEILRGTADRLERTELPADPTH